MIDIPEANDIDRGKPFKPLTEKQIALAHMDRIARKLNQLDEEQRALRIEYWRYQVIAYPVYECHHPDTHFCRNCFDQASDPREPKKSS